MKDSIDLNQYATYKFSGEKAFLAKDTRNNKSQSSQMQSTQKIETDILTNANAEVKPKFDQVNILGSLVEDDKNCIAVIGSRKITDYGRRICDEIVRDVAGAGVTVVSGLMYGVDFHAHKAALESGARTIAVLGFGFDHLKKSRYAYKLAAEIINSEQGAVITEYESSQSATQWTFPKRNRIIAALADVLLIVEADDGSGSMITSEFALEMGKEVVAVPGSIFSNVSRGTNKLIKDGARLIDSADEVLEYFGKTSPSKSQNKLGVGLSIKDKERLVNKSKKLSDKEKQILIAILKSDQSVSKDEISQSSKLNIIDINPILTKLEMDQIIKIDLKGKYVVARLR